MEASLSRETNSCSADIQYVTCTEERRAHSSEESATVVKLVSQQQNCIHNKWATMPDIRKIAKNLATSVFTLLFQFALPPTNKNNFIIRQKIT
jgi:hypothetical protein